ncbi:MAG: pseudouridine-5'-phosphate glycosidase [Phycisphaerales bacterium JB052]
MQLRKRVSSRAVALETTLLVHGVPRNSSLALAGELDAIVRSEGSTPALVGVVEGTAVAGMDRNELESMLGADSIEKVNTANLGVAMHAGRSAATTVSSTMEIGAYAGLRVFATGGIGGVHRGYGEHLDISADLLAFTRFPIAVVTSGVKSILDVIATREALESLGVTVVGFQTDVFPAFYLRDGGCGVDVRFDDPDDLAAFVHRELPRTGRGIVIANPIPESAEIDRADWDAWLTQAEARADESGVGGRDVTPALLAGLHEQSGGRTLQANIELVKSNARLAAMIESRF